MKGDLLSCNLHLPTRPPRTPSPCICSKCHSAFSCWFLLGSVEPQLFRLTSYLPAPLFLLLCSPVMSQPSQNRKEINDSLRTEASATPRPLLPRAHPTWLRVIRSHQALSAPSSPTPTHLTLFSSAHTERPPTPPYQLEPITGLPC